MAHQPTDIQATMAPPAAMTPQALQTAKSETDIGLRIDSATNIVGPIENINRTNPMCVTKAFELFQIATHNMHELQPHDGYAKRKLFIAAQQSLNKLEECLFARLGVDLRDINVDQLEQQHRSIHSRDYSLKSPTENLRYTVLCTAYDRVVKANSATFSAFDEAERAIRIALGEAVSYPKWNDPTATLETFEGSDKRSTHDRIAWNKLMFEMAAGVLIIMARSLSEKFASQSVEMLGTRVSASAFE